MLALIKSVETAESGGSVVIVDKADEGTAMLWLLEGVFHAWRCFLWRLETVSQSAKLPSFWLKAALLTSFTIARELITEAEECTRINPGNIKMLASEELSTTLSFTDDSQPV